MPDEDATRRSSKPLIIGLAGGIGSGKSEAGAAFEECGAMRIISDSLVDQVYADNKIQAAIMTLLGEQSYRPDGTPNRPWIADRVFSDTRMREELNRIIHPEVSRLRESKIQDATENPDVTMIVLDSPLLFESELDKTCDAIVFIDAADQVRRERVKQNRGWSAEEHARREETQLPLSEKSRLADYSLPNNGSQSELRLAVRKLCERIRQKETRHSIG